MSVWNSLRNPRIGCAIAVAMALHGVPALAQVAAPSARSVSPDAWVNCPRVSEGLARIERLNAAAIAARDPAALRDPARRCPAYDRQIGATEKLLNAAEDTRTAVLACPDPAITAAQKNQLGGLLRLQAGMVADTLNHLRGNRSKACPGS